MAIAQDDDKEVLAVNEAAAVLRIQRQPRPCPARPSLGVFAGVA